MTTDEVLIRFKRLQDQAELPKWMSKGAMGCDLSACIVNENNRPGTTILSPRSTRAISTGLAIEPPEFNVEGWTVMLLSRSGLALNSVFVANAPGLIDPDYRGELKVLLYNGGFETQYVKHHDRIAQLVLFRTAWPQLREVDMLTTTERGTKGFGSTGT